MKKFNKAFLFVVFVFAGVQLFGLSISMPEETSQGNFITISFEGTKKIVFAYVELFTKNEKPVQKVFAFPVDRYKKKFVALVGIASWTSPGEYVLKMTVNENKKISESTSSLLVNKTNFPEYTMRLDERNTNLVTKPDPQKAEEARVLTEILTTFNTEAKPYEKTFLVPTPSTRITSEFGERRTHIYSSGKRGTEIHHGVDFGIPANSELVASADGTVVFAGDRIVTGGTLVIEHAPGVYTLFYHLNKNLKKTGDKVVAGEVVALSGSTGFSTGPHLHWELRINTVPVSPFAVVERALY